MLTLVFGLQLALILGLSNRTPPKPRPPAPAPGFRLVDRGAEEFLALNNPALFALPQAEGFSGLAWLRVPRRRFEPPEWSEAPRWLSLDPETLGAVFTEFIETNRSEPPSRMRQPLPELARPAVSMAPDGPRKSVLRREGALTNRRLLTEPDLPSWPHTDLLTNTIVQVEVNAAGKPVSLTLLTSSGLPAADRRALEWVRSARFDPVEPGGGKNPFGRLDWGKMVFDWHTIPTNGVAK
jgi:TonB family protein